MWSLLDKQNTELFWDDVGYSHCLMSFPLRRLVPLCTRFSFMKIGTIECGKFSFYILCFIFSHGPLLNWRLRNVFV